MKTRFSLFGFIAILLLGIGMYFASCNNNDTNGVVTYKGHVVYLKTTTPFPDLEVKVTNGDKIHVLTHTDASGDFSLKVKVSEIDGSYYVLVGDSTCVTKKVDLSGYGQAEVDLGTIEIEGPSLPTVETKPISNVSDNTASCGGNVTSDGRSFVSARGVCWSESEYPTIDDDHTTNGTGLGEFKSQLTNLEAGATYYVRAYATNRMGTSYGEQVSTATATGLPQVTTDEVTNILSTSATCGGDVAANSGYAITARGVCWSNKTATPTIDDAHTSEVATTGHFTSLMIGLERNTSYYVRAYAINEKGANYGNAVTFTTLTGLPTVTTSQVSNIKASSATCGGNVTDNGGYAITARGVCWSKTSSTPSIQDSHTSEVADNGAFPSLMTNLEPASTYYVRAYATNEVGISYGETKSFVTLDGIPVVSTGNITASSVSITAEGSISDDGGFNITARGFCYSTSNATPTIADEHTTSGVGKGNFSSVITKVSVSTTFYVRAYATNCIGTGYGNTRMVTTENGLPMVITTTPTLTDSTVTTGGQITDDGGYPITARGVCYGSLPYPDLTSNYWHTTNGSGTGYYTSTFSLLQGSGVYYIRAYATNVNGTTYGAQMTIVQPYDTLPSFQYGGHTYKVAPTANNKLGWSNAKTYCNNLTIYGYNDWRLPTQAELLQMYNDRVSIGGFYSKRYWSSTEAFSCCLYVDFSNGSYDQADRYEAYYVRPIRVEN